MWHLKFLNSLSVHASGVLTIVPAASTCAGICSTPSTVGVSGLFARAMIASMAAPPGLSPLTKHWISGRAALIAALSCSDSFFASNSRSEKNMSYAEDGGELLMAFLPEKPSEEPEDEGEEGEEGDEEEEEDQVHAEPAEKSEWAAYMDSFVQVSSSAAQPAAFARTTQACISRTISDASPFTTVRVQSPQLLCWNWSWSQNCNQMWYCSWRRRAEEG